MNTPNPVAPPQKLTRREAICGPASARRDRSPAPKRAPTAGSEVGDDGQAARPAAAARRARPRSCAACGSHTSAGPRRR